MSVRANALLPDNRVRAKILQSALCGGDIPLATFERLAESSTVVSYRKGAALWRAGETPQCVTVIARGLVKVFRRRPDGEDVTIALFGPRDPIGFLAVLNGSTYPAEAAPITARVDVIQIPVSAYRRLAGEDPALHRAQTLCAIAHTQHLHAKIDIVSGGSVPSRVASLLLYLADRFGDETDDGGLSLPIDLTRRTVAELVGTRIETVIRIMSAWTHDGVIAPCEVGLEIREPETIRAIARETAARP